MSTVIARGTVIPAKKSKIYTTTKDQQTTVTISVFEGERPQVKDNHKLGKFDVVNIPPAAKGVAKVDVTFAIDENSILTVTGVEQGTGSKKSISITNDQGRLTQKEIDAMIADAEMYAEEDKIYKERLEAKQAFQNYISNMRTTIEDKDRLADKLDEDDKSSIADALTEAEDWLNSNEEASKDDFEENMKDLQRVCDPIIASIYQTQGGQGGSYDEDDEEYEDL